MVFTNVGTKRPQICNFYDFIEFGTSSTIYLNMWFVYTRFLMNPEGPINILKIGRNFLVPGSHIFCNREKDPAFAMLSFRMCCSLSQMVIFH